MRRCIYDPNTDEYLGVVELVEDPEELGKYLGAGPWSIDCDEPDVPPGHAAVVNAFRDGFDIVEKHIGREGYVDGKPVTIREFGPLPTGWSDTMPTPPDTRKPEEKRHDAYVVELDPFRDLAVSYQVEADAWRVAGDLEKAAVAEGKAREALNAYVEKKEEIRARYPDVE